MKRIAITGAAGFLGYHLTKYFHSHGYALSLIDIAPFPEYEYTGNYDKHICDVRDYPALKKSFVGCDFVIHAAAALPLAGSHEICTTNTEGTANVLRAAKESGVTRVVYISSTAVYGVPEKHPIEETDKRHGVGAYGESKIEAEDMCFEAIKSGLPVTIIRPKTFVGTGRLGVFEILFDWIHDGKRIPIIGNGRNRYQLLEVEDLVSAIAKILELDTPNLNDAFNIGAERFATVAEDLTGLFTQVNSRSKILPTPAFAVKTALRIFEILGISPLYQWVHETADRDSFVSVAKLKSAVGWEPKYSNAEALIRAYRWYREHYDEVKSRKSGTTHTVGWKQGILGVIKKFM